MKGTSDDYFLFIRVYLLKVLPQETLFTKYKYIHQKINKFQ